MIQRVRSTFIAAVELRRRPSRLYAFPFSTSTSMSVGSTPRSPADLPSYSFSTVKDLDTFLEREHTKIPGFYLKFAKKSSGILSVSPAEATETALCFGWIDGRAHSIDHKWWLVRYTPRRPKSIWSKKNVDTVSRLIQEGRVRPAGLASIEAAKTTGNWERAYAGPATIAVPNDLAAALSNQPPALAFFESLNKADRYSVLWRMQTASPKTRSKRIEALVQILLKGQRPRALAPTSRPKATTSVRTPNNTKRARRAR